MEEEGAKEEDGGGLDECGNRCGGAGKGFGAGFGGMVQPVGCAADRWRTRSHREESEQCRDGAASGFPCRVFQVVT